jgi:hypothetical protein
MSSATNDTSNDAANDLTSSANWSSAARAEDMDRAAASEPAAAVIHRLRSGLIGYAAVRVFITHRCADRMGLVPVPVAELADRCGVDAGFLGRLMRVLVPAGVVARVDEGVYVLTAAGVRLMWDRPDSLAPLVLMPGEFPWWGALYDLPETVKHGRSPIVADYGDVYGYLAQDVPAKRELFDRAMSTGIRPVAEAISGLAEMKKISSIVDAGGGIGGILVPVLHAHRHIRGTLLEVSQVAKRARRIIAEQDLAGRCNVIEGNIAHGDLPAGADAYLLARILHTHTDSQAVRLLAAARQVMEPHSRLWVAEFVLPADDQPSPAADLDISMMMMTPGRERTLYEYDCLATDAGLRQEEAKTLAGGMALLVLAPEGERQETAASTAPRAAD